MQWNIKPLVQNGNNRQPIRGTVVHTWSQSYNIFKLDYITAIINSPAVRMHLKQDFWSIRGQITYLAPGLFSFNVRSVMTKLIPVATGNTRQALADLTPVNKMLILIVCTCKYTLHSCLFLCLSTSGCEQWVSEQCWVNLVKMLEISYPNGYIPSCRRNSIC